MRDIESLTWRDASFVFQMKGNYEGSRYFCIWIDFKCLVIDVRVGPLRFGRLFKD